MIKKLLVSLLLVLGLVGVSTAQEKITLSTPVLIDAGATQFRISKLILDQQLATIIVQFTEFTSDWVVGGKQLVVSYEAAPATALMRSLNKANLATRSLNQRILDQLEADGKLPPGTITGVVQ